MCAYACQCGTRHVPCTGRSYFCLHGAGYLAVHLLLRMSEVLHAWLLAPSARIRKSPHGVALPDPTHHSVPCRHRQIASIVLAPDFPGWLAPVSFSWTRFGEFCGLTATLTGEGPPHPTILHRMPSATPPPLPGAPAALQHASPLWSATLALLPCTAATKF